LALWAVGSLRGNARLGKVIGGLTCVVPFALRGARIAVQRMRNDVKDWLPDDFPETAELEWFGQHFLGEQFIVISWDGCGVGGADERLKLFLAKLRPEQPSVPRGQTGEEPADGAEASVAMDAAVGSEPAAVESVIVSPLEQLDRQGFIGDTLGLYTVDRDHFNWGGRQEKWLKGNDGSGARWYYITPEGDLYRWDGTDGIVSAVWRVLCRQWGTPELTGELVHCFGLDPGSWYYK
jgi:uncharacterized protein